MSKTGIEQQTARDIMRTNVFTVTATAPLSELERLLSDYRISGAPVTDEAGQIVGVVSLRDLVDRYAEDPDHRPGHPGFYATAHVETDDDYGDVEIPDTSEDTVQDVMTAQVFAIDVDAPITEVAKRLVELGIHRILVEEKGKYVGLISTFDVLRAITGD